MSLLKSSGLQHLESFVRFELYTDLTIAEDLFSVTSFLMKQGNFNKALKEEEEEEEKKRRNQRNQRKRERWKNNDLM